jgi:predicted O-linked N-acetylglucosamine transferase (SPINDLY family)
LQINWIGYPNTTGLETVDYRIVDSITDPPDSSSKLTTEEFIRMPNTFSIYQAPDDLPEPGPLPSLSRGFVTFGSFNSMPKLNDALVRSWCSLLLQNSSSRILVKNIALGFAEPRRQLLDVFEKFGIDPERVDLRGATPGQREHFQTISEVDISLDSFPYNGTTTTCDCLMMGVPVVTRAGEDHRSRVSASHLAALQLESLVGRNDNDCIEIASELARDQQRLEALRAELPDRMRASALMDAEGFTREFEARLKLVWSKRIEKQL